MPRGSGFGVGRLRSARLPVIRWWNLAVSGSIGLSALVMVIRLDAQGLTGDEGFTAQMVKLPWARMVSDLGRIDYNMSAHYLALKAWTEVFGTSEVALRIPSVLFALGALVLWHKLAKSVLSSRVAIVATAFLALNPFFIEVGLTARPYAMLVFWGALATLALVRALDSQTRRNWLWYAVAAVVGLHVHLMAALVIAAHAAFALFYQRRFNRYNLEAMALIVALGIVPTVMFLAPADTLSWIGPFSLPRAAVVALDVAGGGIFGAVVVALALFGIVRRPLKRRMRWLPSLLLVTPVLLILALAPLQSLFVDFYFSVIIAPLAEAAAFGLAWVMKQWETLLVPVGLVVAGLGLAFSLATGGISSHQGWRDLPSMLAGSVMKGDVIAFPNPYYRIVAEYYSPDPSAGPYPPGGPTMPTAAWGSLRPYQLDRLTRTGGQALPEVYLPQTLGHERIWLVGLGNSTEQGVGQDLEANGYRLADIVTSGNSEAVLYVAG